MIKIVSKYLVLMLPVIAAILLLTFEKKEETLKDAKSLDSIPTEYIIDLSKTKSAMSDWGNNKEGSAKFLSGKTGIITIFVGDSSSEWTHSDISTVCEKLDIAVDYLINEGTKYKQRVEFVYNQPDLMIYETSQTPLKYWEESNYYENVYNWIDQDINCEELISKYKLDGIAFLVVLNRNGTSYSVPHSVEDDSSNYYEIAFMYLFDEEFPDRYESPAAYAHELLHLFGATDLYESEYNPISYSLNAYINEYHANALMYTTYYNGQLSVSKSIEQEFTNITAYEVGFLDNCDEVQHFKELVKTYPACFSKEDFRNSGRIHR